MLGLFSLEKRSLGEDQSVFKYLKSIYGKDGWKEVFSRLLAGRTKGYWKKLLQGKFCLDASRKKNTKKKSTLLIKHWNRLSGKVVDYQCSWLDLSRPWITTEVPLSRGLTR